MRFATVLSLLAGSVIATPVANVARQATGGVTVILADFDTLFKQLVALNGTLNSLKPTGGNIAGALALRRQVIEISDQFDKTIADARASSNFTSRESFSISNATISLTTPVNTTLSNLIRKKPELSRAVGGFGDVSKTVYNGLVQQRGLIVQLGQVIVPKLAAPYPTVAPQVIKGLTDIFDRAIAAYKECSGKICLPPIPSKN